MRKIIVLEFVSLDGVMQAPGGPQEDISGGFKYGGWTFPYFDDFSGKQMETQMNKPFELLLGKTTFEIFASYWPHHGADWPGVNEARKYVVSHDEMKIEWKNTVLLKDDVVSRIRRLKEQEGPDLHVYGSGNFVQTLLKHDLVDEFWLKIFPVTLGAGKRLFADGTRAAAFELTDSKVSPLGVVFANYRRAGEVKTGSFVD
ncbi:MAG: dihydrofolate reductase family protein [Nitrosomonadales bacterium]|nr:dihydrofolate reductase family protein [Nitrosomonadales bacterium]